jgi:hypothetical protein
MRALVDRRIEMSIEGDESRIADLLGESRLRRGLVSEALDAADRKSR